MMDAAAQDALVAAIEDLIMSNDFQDQSTSPTRGVRAVQPRAHMRAVAEAALLNTVADRPERLYHLYEHLAKEAVINGARPSDWFDEVVQKMLDGFDGQSDQNDGGHHHATMMLLDVCRHFQTFSRAKELQ